LEVVLEKVRAQEAELRALRGRGAAADDLKLHREKQKVAEFERARALDALKQAEAERAKAKELDLLKAEALRRFEEARKTTPDAEEEVRKLRKAADELKALGRWRFEEARKGGPDADAVHLLEEALKALKAAPDREGQRRAEEALEQALRRLKAKKPT